MTIKTIQTTDTLDTLRTTFNDLTTGVGDISTLVTTSTNVVGAINEIKSAEVTLNGIQTLTNKTLTSPTISSISNSGTLTLPTGTDTIVARTTSDTLTNKTLTSPKISTILTNNGTNTVTLPLANDTLVGKSTTDILSNKTLDTASNTLKINGNSVSSVTGTGSSVVLSTLPTFNSSGIKLSGSYSGTTTIVASSTATGTVTLPSITGTIITSADTGTVTGTMIASSTIRGSNLNLTSDSFAVNTITGSLNGTATNATNVNLTPQNNTNSTYYLTFSNTSTGNSSLSTDTDLSYNPSTNVLATTSLYAEYADLAENYLTDKQYDIGTVIVVGGDKEVTSSSLGKRAIGVISEKPAYLMNAKNPGQPVALKGKVKIKVNGSIVKGDELIADNNGFAKKVDINFKEKVFAIALEDNTTGIIQAIIL